MHLHVEQAQFENGEQSAGARANDQHIGFDRFAHVSFFSVEVSPAGRGAAFGCVCLANAKLRGKP
jgi:hypothetical protein